MPWICTPGTDTVTLPPSWPASPPLVRTNRPLPLASVTPPEPPSPNVALTLLAAISVTVVADGPEPLVACVNWKLPLIDCPSNESWTPCPATSTYGPAGTLIATVVPSTVNCWATADVMVLTSTVNVPLIVALPGRLMLIPPVSWPARPPDVISSVPDAPQTATPIPVLPPPLVHEAPLPSVMSTPDALIRVYAGGVVPGAAPGLTWPCTCSNTNVPESVCPNAASITPLATT